MARECTEEIALTRMIYLEVPQGVSSQSQFDATRRILGAQTLLLPHDERLSFEGAAQLYRRARAMGLTIRKSTDCLIAALAVENDAVLVHNDKDFIALARAIPTLQVYPR
jgi:predicted nucleic acid-binding protein